MLVTIEKPYEYRVRTSSIKFRFPAFRWIQIDNIIYLLYMDTFSSYLTDVKLWRITFYRVK
jgi:hypothetical protein